MRSMAQLPDSPEVRISAERLDIREFGPGDAGGLQPVWLSVNTDNLASLRVA
jgi:hypothetical protein